MKYTIKPDVYLDDNLNTINYNIWSLTLSDTEFDILKDKPIQEPETFLQAYTAMSENGAEYKALGNQYKILCGSLQQWGVNRWIFPSNTLSDLEDADWHPLNKQK